MGMGQLCRNLKFMDPERTKDCALPTDFTYITSDVLMGFITNNAQLRTALEESVIPAFNTYIASLMGFDFTKKDLIEATGFLSQSMYVLYRRAVIGSECGPLIALLDRTVFSILIKPSELFISAYTIPENVKTLNYVHVLATTTIN